MVKALPLTAMKLLAPALTRAMAHKSWQAKHGALRVCGDLAHRVPAYFMRTLPEVFPAFLECVFDTHPRVSALADLVIPAVCGCVRNAEIVGMLPLIIRAIKEPQKETETCLDTLMETTFVNSMDAPSLAVILPIILRGLRERTKEIKQKAAATCGNICALVDDVRDLNPFVPSLKPELEKCEEHSHPDLRECATKAKASLMKGLSLSDSEKEGAEQKRAKSQASDTGRAPSPPLSGRDMRKASVEKVLCTWRSPNRICRGSATPARLAATSCTRPRSATTSAGIGWSMGTPSCHSSGPNRGRRAPGPAAPRALPTAAVRWKAAERIRGGRRQS